MDSELLVAIQAKYNDMKRAVGGEIIVNDPGVVIKHVYHIGHRIDPGKRSIFAQVRVCTHRVTAVRRAVKTYYLGDCQETMNDMIFTKRPGLKLSSIFNEIVTQSQLDHEFICKVHEVFLEAKFIHIIMDLCRGGEIYDYLALNKVFPPDEAYPIFFQLLEALKYLERMHVAHRAICIENILFFDKEKTRIKIISFSSAAFGENFTEKYGCALYMAPEMFTESYTMKCDVWSLGVCFYSMLVGYQPFQGKNSNEVIKKVSIARLPKDTNWSKLPKKMKILIKSMLKHEVKRLSPIELLESDLLLSYHNLLHEITFRILLKSLKQPVPSEEFMLKVQFANKIKAVTIKLLKQEGVIPNLNHIEKIWLTLDPTNTGTIPYESLENLLKFHCQEDLEIKTRFLDIFKRYDSMKNQNIAHDDFLSTIITFSDRVLVLQAFNILDEDKDGVVKAKDMNRFNFFNSEEIEILFTEAMGKTKLTKEDFCSLIMKFSS